MISPEGNILIHSAKLNLEEVDRLIIKAKMSYQLNWGDFLYLCIHHRVVPLVLKNLKELSLLNYVEKHVRRIMQNECNRIDKKNQLIFKEMGIINQRLIENDIKAVLLKGAFLAPCIYENIAIREFSDIDYLIDINELHHVEKALFELGYVQGYYDIDQNKISPYPRGEVIKRRLTTHEATEFLKTVPSDFMKVFVIDINFDVLWRGPGRHQKYSLDLADLKAHACLVDVMGSKVYALTPEYQLVQLCTHLFSEAFYFCFDPSWMRDKGDLNLIKFCDIYELIRRKTINWKTVLELVRRNRIADPVFYALSLTNKIFGEIAPVEFISELGCEPALLNQFMNKQGVVCTWKLPFWGRMFSIQQKTREAFSNEYV